MKRLHMLLLLFITILSIPTIYGYAYSSNNTIIKQGMRNNDVYSLQEDLSSLGLFRVDPTGYFGQTTFQALKSFQALYNLRADGIAGRETIGKLMEIRAERGGLDVLAQESIQNNLTSDASQIGNVVMMPWFNGVNNFFGRGKTAIVTDIDTGLQFNIKRTYGTNHADVETLTKEDTAVLKQIAGGSFNWTRRAVIVEVDGVFLAGSMTAMPHAGRDDRAAEAWVSGRSGGYGSGTNLDQVKNNDMNGHFDIHFLNSRTHGTNRVDTQHQNMIRKAFNAYK